MRSIHDLRKIAQVEFSDIVRDSIIIDHKLRIFFRDGSFMDATLSQKLPDKFGFHWELKDSAKSIYRYDNFPDKNWNFISTYPFHFHYGSQDQVKASPFPPGVLEGFRAFLSFVKTNIGPVSSP